jgi:phosphatidylethanolamine-binding protein (PEBP) family uncharacterized protein
MEIIYKNIYIDEQFLTPQQTQNKPVVSLTGLNTEKKYTLIMYDPNAVNGNFIHWIVTDIFNNDFNSGKELLKYKGPAPPKGTNVHNYIFSLYENKSHDMFTTLQAQFNENHRIIELNKLLNMLFVKGKPIYEKRFTSEYIGGYRRNRRLTKRRKNKKNKKTKRTRY